MLYVKKKEEKQQTFSYIVFFSKKKNRKIKVEIRTKRGKTILPKKKKKNLNLAVFGHLERVKGRVSSQTSLEDRKRCLLRQHPLAGKINKMFLFFGNLVVLV